MHELPPLTKKGSPLTEGELEGLRRLGLIIRRARWDHGWSQRRLERIANVDQTTISRLENGRLVYFSLTRLARLVGVLGGAVDLRRPDSRQPPDAENGITQKPL
jgi:transcriptional regulator with XRE-family HTH domain